MLNMMPDKAACWMRNLLNILKVAAIESTSDFEQSLMCRGALRI